MNVETIILIILGVSLAGFLAAYLSYKSSSKAKMKLCESMYEEKLSAQKGLYEEKLSSQKSLYERMLSEQKESSEKALKMQIQSIRAEMTAQTEKILKEREEELSKKAEETFKNLTGGLDKDMKEMKESFDAQKKAHNESSATLRTHLEEAVKNLRVQTESIGAKADHLASALKGRNKMQGCWGETILENIFNQEGLLEGRDFDREQTLRDEMGIVIQNEESGKRMRPDFILHYPDNTDIIIDCKVDLSALSDYRDAQTEDARDEAAKRNLDAVNEQVRKLSAKSYWDNLKNGRKTLNYVVMFIPVYGSFQLAKRLDPEIVNKAFARNVLITTEETIMPFLRMIRTAWVNFEQVRNQEKIVKAAQNMVERVAELVEANVMVGKKLEDALKAQQECAKKLSEDGRSISYSARQVIKLGVPANPKKKQILDAIEEETDENSINQI